MNITDYCDIINANILVTYYHNQSMRWSASIDGAEVKKDGVLISEYADGATPDEAINKYLSKIRGKTIVLDAYTENRREFIVPKSLSSYGDRYQ